MSSALGVFTTAHTLLSITALLSGISVASGLLRGTSRPPRLWLFWVTALATTLAPWVQTSRLEDAYERLLIDAALGISSLFIRRDETEAAWLWVEPILQHWERVHAAPASYTAGSWGPSAARAMVEADGHHWLENAA